MERDAAVYKLTKAVSRTSEDAAGSVYTVHQYNLYSKSDLVISAGGSAWDGLHTGSGSGIGLSGRQ
jgi:hypothetical protein